MSRKETTRLTEIVARIIEAQRERTGIQPAWVATEAMREIAPARLLSTHPNAYTAAHLHLRQIARGLCRMEFEEDDPERKHPLFPGLQWRYPVPHEPDDEPEYVLLEQLTDDEIDFNVARLLSDAEARVKHADALKRFKAERRRAS
jgi:hypothetical protein